jgi:ribose transport system ATP-binding protein
VDILLLDEPTRGIDVGSKTKIYQILDQLVAGDNPKGIILISSYLPELLGICDRIAVMSQGKLSQAMDIAETDENKIMQLAIG